MILIAIAISIFLLILYLDHVNNGMHATPPEALKQSPYRWTESEIKATFERITKNPIDIRPHLPPKKDRRYAVVGGSGLIGGSLVLQLLARGQPPESIRIIDFRRPVRKDLLRGDAVKVDYVGADVTKEESIRSAFEKPWPSSVRSWPITVFHTAAVIIPEDRARILQSQISSVNTVGTAHVLSAARATGADVFIATSSGSIAIRPCNFWIPPWLKWSPTFVQFYLDPIKDINIRARKEYSGNYAISKAYAEDLVCKANDKSGQFRTGCIRPACGVYGNKYDLTVGTYMTIGGKLPTWVSHIIQNFIHMDNAALAHLLFEEALLSSSDKVGGRSFTVTDPNAALEFSDIYLALSTLTPFQTVMVPGVLMLILAHILEIYSLSLVYITFLGKLLPKLEHPLVHLQPAMLQVANSHQFANNDEIEKELGYKGIYTSLEGICTEVRTWIDEGGLEELQGKVRRRNSLNGNVEKLAAVPAATRD